MSHDKHLRVNFNSFKSPPRKEPTPEDKARFHKQMERDNCAFDKVEILPNNIGYIKFDGFMDAEFCGPTVVAAMGFVAHTDALIFDLRQNGGGQPEMVWLIASYLFDKPTHLIDIYDRKEDTTQQGWTLPYLPGQRMPMQPVFVLTAKRTFSGAEEFAFDLKTQKRATIVGETTGGGAHPVSGHLVADYFMVGRAVREVAGSGDEDELGGNGRGTGRDGTGSRCSCDCGKACAGEDWGEERQQVADEKWNAGRDSLMGISNDFVASPWPSALLGAERSTPFGVSFSWG